MNKFESRLTAPTKDNKYYNSGTYNPFVYSYGMFQNGGNCTCFAYGRMSEQLGKKSNLPTCNAGGWYDRVVGYEKGSKPKLGAIAVWKKKNTTKNEGHVASVEEIFEDGSFTVAESGWKKFLFRTKKINKDCVYGSAYNFLGFIYCPVEYSEEPEVTTVLKSVDEIAKEVIAGKWGNGDTRKQKLTEAGYNFSEVQKRVNEMLGYSSSSSNTKITYTVVSGDNLTKVAKKYNMTANELYNLNKNLIDNENKKRGVAISKKWLYPGQVLVIK